MPSILDTVIERDTYNSLLYTILGGLLLLTTYHLMMFFQNRRKAYFLYSSYTFFSLLAYIPMAESGFLSELSSYLGIGESFKEYFIIIFNCFYFVFFANFLDIKKVNPRWYRIITLPVLVLMVLATVSFLIKKIWHVESFFALYKKLFVIVISVQIIISFSILLRVKNPLKYYIIFGGIVLFAASLVGERSVRELPWINISRKTGDVVYYFGVIMENLAFSFALGYQQKLNHREKVLFKDNFINELKKNEILKDSISRENEKRLLIENEKIRYLQEISDLKLSVLQSQINPHFIFNALNSIKYYVLENETHIAAEYLSKFSNIIRTILTASTMREFTLEQELHTLKIYMDIENLRFNNEMTFSIQVHPAINPLKVKLPPLVLQPFLENAVLHGLSTAENKKVSVEVNPTKDGIAISIKDNGVGRKSALKSRKPDNRESMGLKIVHGMLTNYFGSGTYSITYVDLHENEKPTGTLVVVQIPGTSVTRNTSPESYEKSLYSQT
ncbi:hypothetical protein EIB71_05625 [Kaistella daneshvariae]|uniref:Sensor histidine kinase n=1 Tax=Kaistella daneshvariae TaxID=2487074 RepID=A0ABM7C865_9FLAO|nr:histidine kinase [Kaistella daneshvariae]AZI67177.1 hypothetical protein EIB71_05625 [Kaistella daneshvariae]